jgi:aconitase A
VNTVSHTQRKSGWKQLGWRVGLAAVLVASGYGAWLLIPAVIAVDFEPRVKTMLIAMLGATPLLTKLAAIALFGRPAFNIVKRYVVKFWQR